jgi:hypothetical protein
MKIIVTYAIDEKLHEWTHTPHRGKGEPYSGVRKDRSYKDITISFEYEEDDSYIIDKAEKIIKHEDYTNSDKVNKLKQLLGCCSTDTKFEFDNEEQRCEIYYKEDPPDNLYIKIDTRTDEMSCGCGGGGSYRDIIPIKIYTSPPEYANYDFIKYQYMPGNGWDESERYESI